MRRLLLPRQWSPVRYAELWQEGEALLYVSSSRFSDRYARYNFRDIQGLVLTEFPLWNGWRAAWLGISFFFTLVLSISPPGAWKLWAILPGAALLWAIAFLARGPRCRLVMHTAVSTVTLEAVRTTAQARVALPELQRLTESVQGKLSSDGLLVAPAPRAPEPPAPAHNMPLLFHIFLGMVVLHSLVLAGFYAAGKMEDGLGLSASMLVAEAVMGTMAALRWRAAGPVMTTISALIVALALVDGGVLLYTMGKSFGGLFADAGPGTVKPEGIEWMWLKEQTVVRAGWHAVAGLLAWIFLLTSGRSNP